MKKLFVVMASLFFFAACEKEAQENAFISEEMPIGTLKQKQISSDSILFDKMYSLYEVIVTKNDDGTYVYTYSDGRKMNVKVIDLGFEISGSRINNAVIFLPNLTKDEISGLNNLDIKFLNSSTSTGAFLNLIQLGANNPDLGPIPLKPCPTPTTQQFVDCFVAEWTSFCEDIPSCMAQAIVPVQVAVGIAAHCALTHCL